MPSLRQEPTVAFACHSAIAARIHPWPPLRFLEPVALEFERLAVLGNGPHHVLRSTMRYFCVDLQRNLHIRAHDSGKMRDYLVGDLAGVPTHSLGVQRRRAVVPPGFRLWWLRQRRCCVFTSDSFLGIARYLFSRFSRLLSFQLLRRQSFGLHKQCRALWRYIDGTQAARSPR